MNFGNARVWAYDRWTTVSSLRSGELAGAGALVPVVLSDRVASRRRTARHAVPLNTGGRHSTGQTVPQVVSSSVRLGS